MADIENTNINTITSASKSNASATTSSAKSNGKEIKSILKKSVNFDMNVKEMNDNVSDGRFSPSKLDPYATIATLPYENKADQELMNLAHKHLKSAPPTRSKSINYPRHWLTYPEEATPKYIIDAKKRLGQIKPRTPPNLKQTIDERSTASARNYNPNNTSSQPNEGLEETQAIAKRLAKHFLTYDHPDTPEHIREIRKKYKDERYKRDFAPVNVRSLNGNTYYDNISKNNKYLYSSMKQDEFRKYVQAVSAVPVHNIPTPNLQLQSNSPTNLKRSKSAVVRVYNNSNSNGYCNEQPKIVKDDNDKENEGAQSLASIVQYLDSSSFSNDKNNNENADEQNQNQYQNDENVERYVTNEEKEWLDNEWDRYYGYYSKSKGKGHHDEPNDSVYKTQTITFNKTEIKRPSTVIGLQSRKVSNNISKDKNPNTNSNTNDAHSFEEWMELANDKEKQVVINMLRSIDNTNQQRPPSVQKEAPRYNMNSVTYGMRTRPPSTPQRKLGKTRKHHKFNCEICEKAQIKKHIWDISKTSCPHGGVNT